MPNGLSEFSRDPPASVCRKQGEFIGEGFLSLEARRQPPSPGLECRLGTVDQHEFVTDRRRDRPSLRGKNAGQAPSCLAGRDFGIGEKYIGGMSLDERRGPINPACEAP